MGVVVNTDVGVGVVVTLPVGVGVVVTLPVGLGVVVGKEELIGEFISDCISPAVKALL